MKFEIDRSELISAVAATSKATAQRGTKPILANILIEAKNDKIKFVGTDTESMIMIEVSADVQIEGTATAPAKLFSELISGLPSDSLFPVEVALVNDALVISAGKNSFKILTMSADDFPPVPVIDDNFTEINGKELASLLRMGVIAIGGDNDNPVQRALCLASETGGLSAITTDSKRLALCRSNIASPEFLSENSALIPHKAAIEIISLIETDEHAEIGFFKQQLVVKSDNVTLVTRLVNGKFPDYNRVLPKESNQSTTIYRKEFNQALKSVALIARAQDNYTLLSIRANDMTISSQSKEKGSAEIVIDCKHSGEPINIALNLKYMQDFLSAVSIEEFELKTTTNSYPALFVADELKYICMPMSIIDKGA